MNWLSNALNAIGDFVMDNIVDPIVDFFSSAPSVANTPTTSPVEMPTAPSVPQTPKQPEVISAPIQNDVEEVIPNEPIEEPNLPKRAKSKKTKTEQSKQKADTKAPEKKNNCVSEEECECGKTSWMDIAIKETGVQRYRNQGKKGNSPKVMLYHNSTKLKKFVPKNTYNEMQSWCGSFVNWVMLQAGYKTISYSFRAKAWKKFGKKTKPIYGAIGVKTRSGGGHVSFVVGKSADGKKLYMLGGNQTKHSLVTVKEYNFSDWNQGFYVPKDYNTKNCVLPIYKGSSTKGKDLN